MSFTNHTDARNDKKPMYVQIQGVYGNTPIIFIHGIPMSSDIWREQMKHFAKDYYTLAPDLPGFGKGKLRFNAVTSEYYVEYLLNFLKETGFRKSIWCGLSFGGYLAFRLYEAAPDLCAGLIIANSHPGVDDDAAKARRWSAIKKLHTHRDEFMHKQTTSYLGASSQKNKKIVDEFYRIISSNSDAGISAGIASLTGRVDCTSGLEAIEVPTLFIAGEEDNVTPVEMMRKFHKRVQNSQFEIIPECGHISSMERPDEFNAIVERFVSSLPKNHEFVH